METDDLIEITGDESFVLKIYRVCKKHYEFIIGFFVGVFIAVLI